MSIAPDQEPPRIRSPDDDVRFMKFVSLAGLLMLVILLLVLMAVVQIALGGWLDAP